MAAHRQSAVANKKRHGKHQTHTKDFLKVYWPYVPLVLVVSLGLLIGMVQPIARNGVLAYATSLSRNGLLAATNQERAANGAGSLTLNSTLNQAAQTKAEDMASRDYWSHNTPEGNPPWVFIDNVGYDYKKAGENLAYGFLTSDDTVTGWMNSPSHKENMLLSDYTEVGFGYADVADYQGTGPETIVVAMYAQPAVASASSPAPTPASKPVVQSSNKQGSSSPAPAPTPEPTESAQPATEQPPIAESNEEATAPVPTTTDTPVANSQPSVAVSRLATITRGQLAWLSGLASGIMIAGLVSLAVKHALAVRKWLIKGERYVLHHMLFDITIVSLIGLCVMVSQTAGFVL